MSQVVRQLNNYRVGSVLECGCGVGAYSEVLQNKASPLCSFDINIKLVTIARTHVKKAKFFVASVESLPFRGKCFDTVIATDIIEHLGYPELAIQNIRSVLKDGGTVIATAPSKAWNRIYALLSMRKEDIGHYNICGIAQWEDAFIKEGLYLFKYRRIQSFLSAFIDSLVAKLCLMIFGNSKVLHSEMATETARHAFLGVIYLIFNRFIYPLLVFFELILPQCCKTEYLMVFKKKG